MSQRLDDVYQALAASAPLTALVGDSIYSDRAVPDTDLSTDTVNIYGIGNLQDNDLASVKMAIASCKADSYGKSIDIAEQVFDILNRRNLTENTFTKAAIREPISPTSELDVYNTQVLIELY